MESRGAADGERKTITALFADLKGSTALIEGLDPEDARAIIDPALQLMMDAVHRYDGYVAQSLGDGIFALFGAPIAHEDHPQRALYAALRMQEAMRGYSDDLRRTGRAPLQMRVGINTGEVVVRSIRKDDLHTDYVPIGHSTNLAARMEQLAHPGSILVTAYTHRLTDGYFAFQALGEMQIKGVDAPLNVYEVTGAGPLRTRLQVSVRRGLTRFVGRQGEMEQMQQALEQAKDGHGQIVGVTGEPGLGKSRLFYEFKLTSQSGCLVLEAFSVSHGKGSPYLPVIELLKTYFDIAPEDTERSRRERVIGKVLGLDRSLEDTLPYLFALLGIEEESSPLQGMDAQIRRQRTLDALKRLWHRESLNQPLILVFEDLHWIDTETQGFLDTLSESLAATQILVLVNYRPEYRHEWGSKTYYTQLRLAPLGTAEAEELLTFLLGTDVGATGRSPLQAIKRLILERTDGTPFFMEEVVQTLAEEGALSGERGNYRLEKTPTELHISPTVQGVLAARIDRLTTEEKELLQQLSVIGRQFPISLVKQVVMQAEDDLYRLVGALQAKEFLYEQPAFPEVEYLFKHALTQDVAYSTVLQEQRKTLHERTGQAMETLYQGQIEDHYRELAHHYSHSGNNEKAVEYLQLAGQQAARRSANEEAVGYVTTALELLTTLPDTSARSQQELSLRIALGETRMAAQGYAAPGVEDAYIRARELCQRVGATSEQCVVLWGLWAYTVVRGEVERSRQIGEELLSLAQLQHDPAHVVGGHRTLGESLSALGELTAARTSLEHGLALSSRHHDHSDAVLYDQDPEIDCLSRLANVLWRLGYPDQARQRCDEALRLARELGHPVSLASTLAWTITLYQHVRAAKTIEDYAEPLITLGIERGLPFWLALGITLRGWALAQQGQHEEGVSLMREGMANFRATGAEIRLPFCLALLAEAQGTAGQYEEGLRMLTEALYSFQSLTRHTDNLIEGEMGVIRASFLEGPEGFFNRHQVGGIRGQEEEVCAGVGDDLFRLLGFMEAGIIDYHDGVSMQVRPQGLPEPGVEDEGVTRAGKQPGREQALVLERGQQAGARPAVPGAQPLHRLAPGRPAVVPLRGGGKATLIDVQEGLAGLRIPIPALEIPSARLLMAETFRVPKSFFYG